MPLLKDETSSSGPLAALGRWWVVGGEGEVSVFRSAFFFRRNRHLVAGTGGQDRFVGTWLMRGDKGGGGNESTLFIPNMNGCQRSIMLDMSMQL